MKLLHTILNWPVEHRFILGIDGLSRSGKTTFAKSLRETLRKEQRDICLFHLDDHIVDRKNRYDTGNEEWHEYYHLQWDVDYLRENLFAKLRMSGEINLLFYNIELDKQFARAVLLPKNCIVIVEGGISSTPAVAGVFRLPCLLGLSKGNTIFS